MTAFEALIEMAKFLEAQRETETHGMTQWAEENPEAFDVFADILEMECMGGEITYKELVEIALVAFYDYDIDYERLEMGV